MPSSSRGHADDSSRAYGAGTPERRRALRAGKGSRHIIVVGVCAAVALPVVLATSGRATDVEALIAGLLVATIALVADGAVQAERRFQLRALMESSDWLPSGVLSLATSTRQIMSDHAEPEIVAEARNRLVRAVEEFERLAEGRIWRPAGDYQFLIAGTAACHRRLEAVTEIPAGSGGPRWWDSDIGRRYWQANLDALSRGVSITRIFVCTRMDPDLAEMIAVQSEAGVRTLVAPRESTTASPTNLVVWDGHRAWEACADPNGGIPDDLTRTVAGGIGNLAGGLTGNLFTVNERDLQRLTGVFTAWAAGARLAGG